MSALDCVTDVYGKTGPLIESPPRPTMISADYLSAQFTGNPVNSVPAGDRSR